MQSFFNYFSFFAHNKREFWAEWIIEAKAALLQYSPNPRKSGFSSKVLGRSEFSSSRIQFHCTWHRRFTNSPEIIKVSITNSPEKKTFWLVFHHKLLNYSCFITLRFHTERETAPWTCGYISHFSTFPRLDENLNNFPRLVAFNLDLYTGFAGKESDYMTGKIEREHRYSGLRQRILNIYEEK